MSHLALPSCVCCSSEYAEVADLVREQSDPSRGEVRERRAPKGDPHLEAVPYYSYSLLSHTSPFSLSSLSSVTSCSTHIDTPSTTIPTTLPTPLGSSHSFTFTFAIHPFEWPLL
jgi:hypothetical protein